MFESIAHRAPSRGSRWLVKALIKIEYLFGILWPYKYVLCVIKNAFFIGAVTLYQRKSTTLVSMDKLCTQRVDTMMTHAESRAK